MTRMYHVMRLSLYLGLFIVFGLAGVIQASVKVEDIKLPAEGNIQILTLDDGSSLNGEIIEVNDDNILFKSSVGEMTIAVARIVEIQEVSSGKFRNGKYWFPNPNQTRMYLGPTARMLEKGKGYFSDIYVFFPGVAYGVTDNFTIGGGMSIFPGLDLNEQLFFFNPKIGLKTGKDFSLAVAGLITVVPDWSDDLFDEPNIVGTVFGVGTYGTEDKSITFGLGFGYADEDFADKPAVIFGGEYRLGRRISFVSENWSLPGVDPVLLSYGLRFFGEGIAIDLAFLNVANEDAVVPGIPFIDFVWNF